MPNASKSAAWVPPFTADALAQARAAEVLVFNFKQRYTGVSATVNALLPVQREQWRLAYCGTALPSTPAGLSWRQAMAVSRQAPPGRAFRIWHVRRDPEMMLGLWARDVLKLPIRLVFTSAAQRRHGPFPRWLISRMDAVIATTPQAAACVANTTAVVPHGIDARCFCAVDKSTAWAASGLPGRFGIGAFGRVRPDKGSDLFVDALIAVLPDFAMFSAVIAGLVQPRYAAYAQDLQRRIDSAGLSERIRFIGEVPAAEVAQWYQRCLLTVACPREEPFGLTPFEAAATGSALLCSRTGAFEQLVREGVEGQLVPTDDLPALTRALRTMLADPPRLIAMGQAARQRVVEQFSVQAEADGIARVYAQLFAQDLPGARHD